jgi:hypothetical protein
MRIPRKPWFPITDPDDEATLSRAFLVAGVITANPKLRTISDFSVLRGSLKRRLGQRRRRAVTWQYPDVNAEPAIQLEPVELAQLFGGAAEKGNQPSEDRWYTAIRLEVPVPNFRPAEARALAKDVYDVLGLSETPRPGTTNPAIAITFTKPRGRRAFSFDWPLRVASSMPELRWSAPVLDFAEITDVDATADLAVSELSPHLGGGDPTQLVTVPDLDILSASEAIWERLMEVTAAVVPGIPVANLPLWLEELTRSLSLDRLFDVATFEAWDRIRARPSETAISAPLLFAWRGAFDHARLSDLFTSTVRELRSQPKDQPLSVPPALSQRLALAETVSISELADRLENLRHSGDSTVRFSRGTTGGETLSLIRPIIKATEAPRSVPAGNLEEERFVNAWIEGTEPPLAKGRRYRLGINIGRRHEHALATGKAPRIDWGTADKVEILVILTGLSFNIEPRAKRLTLPKRGESDSLFFCITPLVKDPLPLRVSLYIAGELTLLDELEIPLTVEDAREAA